MVSPLAVLNEREPTDLTASAVAWVQVSGVLAAFGLLLWGVHLLVERRRLGQSQPLSWRQKAGGIALASALVCYVVAALLLALSRPDAAAETSGPSAAEVLFTTGGVFALAGVLGPFVKDCLRLRGRRIWALARLSFQEALRRKVLWVFVALLLVALFGSWFLPHKPEHQVRTYVQVVFGAMTPLLLLTAGLLAAFGIPADVQHQTIYTLVTKPVERFEIIVGRFLGYTLLMTAVLAVVSVLSLTYVLREIDPDAAFQNLRARMPLYGRLEFEKAGRRDFQGLTSFMRLDDRRRLIRGGKNSSHRAVWVFTELPPELAQRDVVPCEFEFDITRTETGGEEGKGVGCTLSFRSWRWDPVREGDYRRERDRDPNSPAHLNRLAEEYGIYEETRPIVNDYTYSVSVPGGLFKNALRRPPQPPPGQPPLPLVQVYVKCEDEAQHIGVARTDLYLLAAEGWFALNFFKGTVGLWLRLCLVIGVAVACSTYLSGVISWLSTMFLFGAGLSADYIRNLALGSADALGPGQSAIRLVTRLPSGLALEQTPTTRVAAAMDEGFRWFLRGFLRLVPDVNRLDWTEPVAAGFDISVGELVLNGLLLAAYLLPWAVLAHYLMKSREMAA